MCTLLYTVSPVAADEVTERVDSVGDLEEDESSSVGSSVETSSEDLEKDESSSVRSSVETSSEDLEEDESSSVGSSVETLSENLEEEKSNPRVQKEVGSRNDGIFNSIDMT